MKKLFAMILVFAALLAVFCACGDGKTENKTPEVPDGPAIGDNENPNDNVTPVIPEQPEEDPRWADEVITPEVEAIVATADAYFARRRFIQYDQLNMNRIATTHPRYEFGIPEFATARKIVHMDCGIFIRNVFQQALNYTTPGASTLLAENYANTNGERVFYWVGKVGQTPEDEAKAKQELIDTLQPGDILFYNYVENNHVFLYLGGGEMIHCSGNDYSYNAYKDGMESSGAIIKTTVDGAFTDRDIFDELNKVCLLRPLNVTKEVTEQAKIRVEKLQKIVINKTTTAPEGISVTPGGEVTVKITVKNNRTDEAAKFTVTDTVPQNMEYVSGADKFENGTLSWDITVGPRDTETIEYTFKVKKDESLLGKILPMAGTKIDGYILNDTPVYVGVTLAQDKQDAITAIKTSDLKATTDAELIKAVYEKAGLSVTAQNSTQYMKDLFVNYPTDNINGQTNPVMNTDTVTGLSFVPELYGGKACSTMATEVGVRTRRVYEYNIIPGDIIVRALMLTEEKTNLYVYLGEERVVTVKDGKVVEEDSGNILESLLGQSAFCILRPSLCYPMDETQVKELSAPVISTQPKAMSLAIGNRKGPTVAIQKDAGIIYSYQWYKNSENKNSGGTALKGATEAQSILPVDAFTAGEKAYLYCVVTATRVFDGKTAQTVSETAEFTAQKGKTNILLVGSGVLKRDGKFDVGEYLASLLKAGGEEVSIDYITRGNDYNIWESGLTGNSQVNVQTKLEEKSYSHLILQMGRDYVLTTSSTRGREVAAYKNIVKMVQEISPETEIVLVLGPWRPNTEGSWYTRYKSEGGFEDAEGHKKAILKYYEEYLKPITDAKVIDAVAVFEAAINAGINPYDGENSDYPGLNGAYLIAGTAYGIITGKAPVGLNVFTSSTGAVTAENAQKLQEIASDNLKLSYTPTKLDTSKEDTNVDRPEPDGNTNILLIGSGVLKRDGKFDMGEYLKSLLKAGGNEKVSIDYITKGNDYNIWESGLTGSSQSTVKSKLQEKHYSYIILQAGRDYVLNTESTREKELTAYSNIIKMAKAYSPDCEILVVLGPWRDNTEGNWYKLYSDRSDTIKNAEDHKKEILKYFETYLKPLADVKLIDAVTAFEAALKAGVNPFDGEKSDYPGQNGAYLIAGMAYGCITGKSPVGLNVFTSSLGSVTAAEAKKMQEVASDVLKLAYTPTELDPSKEEKPEVVVPQPGGPVNVLLMGDIPLKQNGLADTLQAMLGADILVQDGSYAGKANTPASRISTYEFFKFSGNTVTGWGSGNTPKAILSLIEGNDPEYIVVSTNRRSILNADSTTGTKGKAAVKWLSENYPNAKILLIAEIPYPDGTFDDTYVSSGTEYTIGQPYTGATAKEHAEKILAAANDWASGLKNVQVVKMCDAFVKGTSEGLKLYNEANDATKIHPNRNGSYMMACMLYTAITGKPATGLPAVSGIETAEIQTVADSIK